MNFVYRLWNYDTNYYQAYNCNSEIVEFKTKRSLEIYLRNYKGNYRVDKYFPESNMIKKNFFSLINNKLL